jgi:hypothetical protein
MNWQSISDMVLRLQEHINEVPTNLDTRAQGGIKRQAYGPGLSQRKWIYVQGYEARRWIASRPLKIVVASEERNKEGKT